MADDLGWEPIPGVAGASGCPHPTRLLTPICSRKRGRARQVDGACSRKRGKTRQVDGALLTIEQPYSGKTELMGEDQLYAPSLRKPYPVTEINPLESLAERVARRLQPKYPY